MSPEHNEPKQDKDMNTTTPIETNLIDEQWQTLTQDWQAQPVEKTDMAQLVRQTKRRTLKAKSLFFANVFATISLIISWLYGWFMDDWDKPLVIYLGVGSVLSVVFCYYEFKIRQNIWRQISDSPEQALQNAIKGHESSISYIRLTKWSCLPFGMIANWFVYETAMLAEKSPLEGVLAINVFILVVYLITHWFGVKRKNELKSLLVKESNK